MNQPLGFLICVTYANTRHIDRHVLQKNAVPRGGIVDEDVCYRADELSVLDDRRARQECGQNRTTKSIKKMFLNFCAKVVING